MLVLSSFTEDFRHKYFSFIIDNDTVAGFTLSTTSVTVSEAGASDTFTVVLDAQPPSGNVVLAITSADTGEAKVAPETLTFTSETWNIERIVTVTGVDDSAVDGTVATVVTLAIDADKTNPSTGYNDVANGTVTVSTTDNDRTTKLLLRIVVAQISLLH